MGQFKLKIWVSLSKKCGLILFTNIGQFDKIYVKFRKEICDYE